MTAFPPSLTTLPTGLRPGGRFADWRPRPPRYAVADVDGTLVGVTGRATAEVTRAVAACREAGLPVGLATGRMPEACWALADAVGLTGPHVVHNGAEVIGPDGPLERWPLPRAEVDALLAACRRHGLYAELYGDRAFWATDRRPEAQAHWELLGLQPSGLVEACDLDAVLKATVVLYGPEDVDAVLADLAAAGLTSGLAHAPGMPDALFVNVTVAGADKGSALRVAAGHLGCDLDEVVAIGDGLNDLSMLAVAGTAVAMGQSLPEVQAAAHLVVPEQDADGVAHALDAAVSWRVTG